MNDGHEFCGSDLWRETVRDQIIPWALDDGLLGDDALEVGPGYGATTEVFAERVGALTAVEIDPALAARLADRFDGTNVTVVEADATALPFDDDRFTGAACFSMLHHVPSTELQDRLFAEVARVLRPGALFVATDSVHSDDLADFHAGDTYVPLDPDTLVERFAAAGFTDVDVATNEFAWSVRCRAGAREPVT